MSTYGEKRKTWDQARFKRESIEFRSAYGLMAYWLAEKKIAQKTGQLTTPCPTKMDGTFLCGGP